MNEEFLKGLGLEDSKVISKILKEAGKIEEESRQGYVLQEGTVSKEKFNSMSEDRDKYKGLYEEADENLKSSDVAGLQAKIKELESSQLSSAIKEYVNSLEIKPRDISDLGLDLNGLTIENFKESIERQVKEKHEEKPYLFLTGEKEITPIGGNLNTNVPSGSDSSKGSDEISLGERVAKRTKGVIYKY